MSSIQGKPLQHWSKQELDQGLANAGPDMGYSTEQIAAELNRRDRVKAERRSSKSIDKMTDGELKYELKVSATNSGYHNGLRQELERRGAVAQARTTRDISIVSILLALAAILVAVLKE